MKNDSVDTLGFKLKKRLGQHFLTDENIARKIVGSLNIKRDDVILEIGPGSGVLTKFFLPEAKRVIGVELDPHLVEILRRKYENLEIIQGDFLKLNLRDLIQEGHKLRVVGNIPYYITSPVIFKVMENRELVQDLTIMVQREVAKRIVSSPGTKDFGILSVVSQVYSQPEILFYVSKNVFSPRPKVDSAVVQFRFPERSRLYPEDDSFFIRVLKTCFGMRRKKLRNSLKALPVDIRQVDFDLDRRPEELTIEEWVRLCDILHEKEKS